jgi:hypothetical protein
MANSNLKSDPKSIKLDDIGSSTINPATEDKQDILIALNKSTNKYAYTAKYLSSTYKYFVFVDADGGYYVLRMSIADKSAQYSKGDTAFPTDLTGCEALIYDTYNLVF